MTILVSPAEPAALRKIGPTSPLPETLGADFLIVTEHGFVGVQRKEVRDLVASIRGDRIARELGQSGGLLRMVLIVEGDWAWDRIGSSRTVPGLLKAQYDGFCLSIQSHGWWVLTSETMTDTARLIGQVDSWWQKPNHGSLYQRPKSRALWGTHRNREWGVHLLQSFDGIGVDLAGRIYDHFDGVPLRLTCTMADLMVIPGVGKGRAARIMAALDTDEMVDGKNEDMLTVGETPE
jgi:ERCC4-type nuclease